MTALLAMIQLNKVLKFVYKKKAEKVCVCIIKIIIAISKPLLDILRCVSFEIKYANFIVDTGEHEALRYTPR